MQRLPGGKDDERGFRLDCGSGRQSDYLRRHRARPLCLHRRRRSQFWRHRRRRRRDGDRRAGHAGDGAPSDRAGRQSHRQADQICAAHALSRRAGARRFGLCRRRNSSLGGDACADRRARQGGYGFRDRPLPAAVSRRRKHSRPDLALDHVSRPDVGVARPPRGAHHAYRPRSYGGRRRRLRAGRGRRVFRRPRRIPLGLLLRRCAFHRLAGDARPAGRVFRQGAGAGPRRGAQRSSQRRGARRIDRAARSGRRR